MTVTEKDGGVNRCVEGLFHRTVLTGEVTGHEF